MKIVITTFAPIPKKGEDKWAAVAVYNNTSITGYGKRELLAILDAVKRIAE